MKQRRAFFTQRLHSVRQASYDNIAPK